MLLVAGQKYKDVIEVNEVALPKYPTQYNIPYVQKGHRSVP